MVRRAKCLEMKSHCFFLSVLVTGIYDYCPKLTGENIAQGERSLEMFSGDVFKQRMLWFLLLVEIPLDTELEN